MKEALAWSLAALIASLLGTFYLSAQAIGFDNIRRLLAGTSDLVLALFGPGEITYVEGGDSEQTATRLNLVGMVVTLVASVPSLVFIILNVFIFHSVLGILLVIGWIGAVNQAHLSIGLPAEVVVAIALYIAGSWVFGETAAYPKTCGLSTPPYILRDVPGGAPYSALRILRPREPKRCGLLRGVCGRSGSPVCGLRDD